MNTTRRGGRALIFSSLLIVVGLAAAACGDDDGGGDAATTAAPTSAAATTAAATTAAAPTTAAAGGDLAAAQAAVADALARPTKVSVTEPVGAEIPTGKKVIFITCGVPVCEKEGPIIKEATDILGWDFSMISTDGTQTSVSNAWDQAVREKPDVVLYTAFDRSQVETQIQALADGGTFISSCCHTNPPEDGIGYVISTPEQGAAVGKLMADWVVTDMAGTPAGVVYLDLPEFAILTELGKGFETELKALCADCKFESKQFALADLGTAADQVVSYLRSNPDTKYVVMSTDSAFGLSGPLEAAGLSDVKLFGEGPGEANLADILAGKQAGSAYFDYYGYLFAMVDAAARHFAGVPQVPNDTPEQWILTKDNMPTQDPAEIFPGVPDIVDQYKALWGKS